MSISFVIYIVHLSAQYSDQAKTPWNYFSVKVQFRGPEIYKKNGALLQEEFYLPRIFRSSSLNLHTFHAIYIVF